MKKQYTRQDVARWCSEREIELLVENVGGEVHVHANIDADHMIFRAHGLHNLGLGNYGRGSGGPLKPNWTVIMRELLNADFGPCEDADCEWCN
jgi:hypothetical protein